MEQAKRTHRKFEAEIRIKKCVETGFYWFGSGKGVGHMEMATTRQGWFFTMVCSNLEFDRLARLGTVVKKTRKSTIKNNFGKSTLKFFARRNVYAELCGKSGAFFTRSRGKDFETAYGCSQSSR